MLILIFEQQIIILIAMNSYSRTKNKGKKIGKVVNYFR